MLILFRNMDLSVKTIKSEFEITRIDKMYIKFQVSHRKDLTFNFSW